MTQATLVRNITVELNTGTEASPTWTPVEGINNVSHTPNTIRADTRTFDDAGWERHQVAARGHSFTFGGLKHIDESTGDRPPGQEAVESWANDMGVDSLKQFRINDESGAVMITFTASSENTLIGGGNDDADNWGFTVQSSGAPS